VQWLWAVVAGALSGAAGIGLGRRLARARSTRARTDGAEPARASASPMLTHSEEVSKQFFDTITDFLFVLDEEGRILKVNRTVTQRLGFSEEELRGRPVLSLHPKAEQAKAEALMSELLSGAVEYCPIPIETKDGVLIPVESRGTRGYWNGRPVIFGVSRDIGGLRASEEKFAKAFHASPALMALIKVGDLTVVDVNQAFLDVMGFSREEAIGKRPSELNLFTDLNQRDYLREQLANGRQLREVELQLRTRAGELRDGLVSAELLWLAHDSLVLAVFVDITERKRDVAALRTAAAELERKNQELAVARDAALDAARAKSHFLANMSHEIRTPLNGMLGLAELLSRSPLGSDQREYVDSISRCGDLLLSVVNDILDFSKIEAGRLQVESIPFDLHTLVFDVVEFYGSKTSPADVEFIVDLDPQLPIRLVGDPGRLRQVLGNLVGNAVKFTAKGHILIEAKHVGCGDGKATMSIAVCDTGEGIPDDVQRLLFQPFTQADASTSRKHGGTGLGLALCKRIVDGMGGEIFLSSHPGQGTTFTVRVTLSVDETGSAPERPLALSGKRCLVVDDSALVCAAMEKMLRQLGAEVAAVLSGEEALGAIDAAWNAQRAFDLVLIDGHMPGLGGESLAKVLRSDARLARTGIVMLAPMFPSSSTLEAPLVTGAYWDGHLAKPARAERLAQVLGMVLENKRTGRSGVVVTRHSLSSQKTVSADANTFPFPLRVLLAEDNDVSQLVAWRMLEEVGASVTVAADGHQALAALERGTFDLVMMDCHMPGLDGFTTTTQVRAREKVKGGHLPILAVTANTLPGDRELCLAAGMDGYLAKPFSRQALLREIVRLVATGRAAAGTGPEGAANPNLDRARFKDMAHLLGSTSSDGHTMLLRSFQGNTEKRIEQLARAIEGGDPESAYGVAHAIKGSSGNLGFVGLEQLAGQLEGKVREGRLGDVSAELAAIREELGRVQAFLHDYFKQTASDG
jgi:two-component system, sensor histidine kinase and response regulator